LSGSPLSVTGPAAGLTTLVHTGIAQLGDQYTVCVLIAGVVQVLLGAFDMGALVLFVPNSVVRAMLAAVGLTLILKQLPHALGYDADFEGDFEFFQPDGENTFTGLLHAFSEVHPGAIAVAAVTAGVLLAFTHTQILRRFQRYLPRELIAIVLGTAVSEYLAAGPFALSSEHRLELPRLTESIRLLSAPALDSLVNPDVWRNALALAFVGSIEALLCIEAVDRIAPGRAGPLRSRELTAQGIGNAVSGLLGGLPVSAVIVRSVTNVQAGARSRAATMLHGVLLTAEVVLLSPWLRRIPLAALAVVLIGIGLRLTHPQVFRAEWREGAERFAPFAATVAAVLLTDMLIGALVGLCVALFFQFLRQYRSVVLITDDGPRRLIRLGSDVTFVHRMLIARALQGSPECKDIVVDGSRLRYMDEEASELLRTAAERRGARWPSVEILRNPANTHPFFRDEESVS
jgi:MFS superfamily sulfate permease-like transporter